MRRGSAHVGNTVLGMGFSLSDVTAALESGAATAAGAFLQTGSAQPVVQAAQQQAVQSAGASSFAWAQTHWKQIGLGILIGVVALGGTFYYLGRKK